MTTANFSNQAAIESINKLTPLSRFSKVWKATTTSVLTLALLISVGCSSEEQASLDSSKSAEPSEVLDGSSESTVTSVASNSTTVKSPAVDSNTNPLPDKLAPPEDVCDRFLELIHSGKRGSAEQLLTRVALAVTSRAGLELEPLGGSGSSYKVGQVFYATTKKKIAHVNCSILQTGTQPIDVTWTMKKTTIGWRITGVILENEQGKPDLLSFENPYDVAQMRGPVPSSDTVVGNPAVIDGENDGSRIQQASHTEPASSKK